MTSPADDIKTQQARAQSPAPPDPTLFKPSLLRTLFLDNLLVAPIVGILLALALHYGLDWLQDKGAHIPAIADLAGSAAYYRQVLAGVGIAIILGVSLNIVNGYTGQFALGHAGFMAIGGYAAGLITYYGSFWMWGEVLSPDMSSTFTKGHILLIAAVLIGGLFAAIAGYAVGLPSLRLRGDYLAIVTLGFGEIVSGIVQLSNPVITEKADFASTPWWKLPAYTGGSLGFTGPPALTRIFWIWLFVAITVIVAYRLKFSSQGRAFLSIRENEVAAEAMGVPVTRYKVRAFVVAAFFAGIAGGLYAHNLGNTLVPGELGFAKSIEVVILVVLGGTGSISGTVIAAIILTILPERFRDFQQYSLLAYAAALILMMLLRPKGLLGIKEIWQISLAWLYQGLGTFIAGYIAVRLICLAIPNGWTATRIIVFTLLAAAHFLWTHRRLSKTAPSPTSLSAGKDHTPIKTLIANWLWVPFFIGIIPLWVYTARLAAYGRWLDVLFFALIAAGLLLFAKNSLAATPRRKGATA